MKKTKPLKKELRLFDVYAIATGTTLSAGFFLLPGLAANLANEAIVLAYMIAAIPMIPAMFSMIELSTAMPRAGGLYYFLDRSMGPMFGTIGGLGTYLALVLKVAFSLVGMGAYIKLFFPEVPITPIAVGLSILIGVINFFGTKKSGRFQIVLVVGLLGILAYFIGGGLPEISFTEFKSFFHGDFSTIFATAGLVYISYVGVTKVASLSEEVKNPERNLPLGIMLALGTAIVVYALGTAVMVSVLPMNELQGDLTPVSTAARSFLGYSGSVILAVAAMLAFISVANAGTMSASRYPLAMSRDHIVPGIFRKLGKQGTPVFAIILTVATVIAILLLMNPTGIAKLASAFQLLMFALICFAVIIMRESRIASYDPGYNSPFYPYMQIFGIIAPFFLIYNMGLVPTMFSIGLIFLGVLWYIFYVKKNVGRSGAVYHIFARLGEQRNPSLDSELRGILKEKGLRKDDPFDEVVMRSNVIDLEESISFEDAIGQAAEWFEKLLPITSEEVALRILEGTKIGATPVVQGVALPHFRCEGLEEPEMVLVRSKPGMNITIHNPLTHEEEATQLIHAIFFLVSPEDKPGQHLRILAQIAGRVDDDSFNDEWFKARDEQELKEALLHDERFLSIYIREDEKTSDMISRPLRHIKLPEGCLIPLIRRGAETIIPRGDTIFKEGDRLTVIGDKKSMKEFRKMYLPHNT